MCVYSSNGCNFCLSHLHLLVFAVLHLSSGAPHSCSNCHRSDCSSLDAMEAVIGHPRHSDQCHRYYRDFRHPGPRQQAQSRPKGNWKWGRGEAPQLVMAAQRLDSCLSECVSTAQRPACICSRRRAHWHFPFTEHFFRPHHIPHTASLMELFSFCFSCCHTSPVKGSYCVQSTVEILCHNSYNECILYFFIFFLHVQLPEHKHTFWRNC